MLSVSLLLLVSAFVCNILYILGKCPVWVGIILINIWALLTVLPLNNHVG